MTRTRVTLLTAGDPDRVTGGYLFHRRLAERASRHDAEMNFVSIPELPLPWAILTGPAWLHASARRAADVVVLDSIAAGAAAPWLGRFGAPVVGPAYRALDVMLGKAFPIKEQVRVEFRLEAFNVTNTPSLMAPNVSFGNAAFGTITRAYDPRVFEFALKVHF